MRLPLRWLVLGLVFTAFAPPLLATGDEPAPPTPTREETAQALRKATAFFHQKVSHQGGYLWQYSGDLSLREAEGRVADSCVWVQPPGTPTVGEAFLDAYEVTGDKAHLDAAFD